MNEWCSVCWDRGNTQYSSHTDSVWSSHVTLVIRLRVMRWFVIRNVDWYVVCVQSSQVCTAVYTVHSVAVATASSPSESEVSTAHHDERSPFTRAGHQPVS